MSRLTFMYFRTRTFVSSQGNVAYVLYEFFEHFSIKPVSTNRDTTNSYATQIFTVEAILYRDASTFTKMTWVHVCEQCSCIARFVQTSNSLYKNMTTMWQRSTRVKFYRHEKSNKSFLFQKFLRLRRRLSLPLLRRRSAKKHYKTVLKGALSLPSAVLRAQFRRFLPVCLCRFVCRIRSVIYG